MRSIAILNLNNTISAFIAQKSNKIMIEHLEPDKKDELERLILSLTSNQIYSRKEHKDKKNVIHFGIKSVSREDPSYLAGLTEVINFNGLRAVIVYDILKPYIISVNDPKLPLEQRQQLITTLVNVTQDYAQQLADKLNASQPVINEIVDNRKKWKEFLQKRTDEILDE